MRGRRQTRKPLDSPEPREDKEWAKRYILDPLTDPEPSQVDGPGTSFFNPRRSLSVSSRPKDLHFFTNRPRRNSCDPAPRPPVTTARPIIHHPKPIAPGVRHSSLPPTNRTPADAILNRVRTKPAAAKSGPTVEIISLPLGKSAAKNATKNTVKSTAKNTAKNTTQSTTRTAHKSTTKHSATEPEPVTLKAVTYRPERTKTTERSEKDRLLQARNERTQSQKSLRTHSSTSSVSTTRTAPASAPASAPLKRRPSTSGQSLLESLTSVIRIPSQSLSNLKLPPATVVSVVPPKTPKTKTPAPRLRRSTVQISDCYHQATTTDTATTTSTSTPPPPAPPPKDIVAPTPSPHSSVRSSRASRRPPQTHHTQRTAEILGEILTDKTNTVNNRATVASVNGPVTVPIVLRTTSSVAQRLAAANMSQSQSQPQFQSDAKSRSETVPLLGSKSSSDSKPQAEEDSKPPLDSKSRPRSDSKPRSPSKPQQMPLRPRSESKPQSRTQSPTKPHMSSDVRPVRDRRYDDMMSPRGSQRSLNSLNPYYSQSSSSHQRSRSAIMPGEMPGHYRSRSSLGPGDMAGPSSRSHEKRSSSSRRHQSHRGRGNRPLPDTIDTLDNSGFGPAYHHGGPYDATLATVNKHKKTSPLEAVKKSNLEALKATPREFIVDSLRKHVPLQGTATIPPGMPDFSGRIMDYEEGADLMREPDAAGGAYKRYDFLKYHPDDLKGKGEPSFTIERALKEGKSRRQRASFSYGSGAEYELQDRSRPPVSSNGRSSFSSGRPGTSEGRAMQTAFEAAGTSGTVQRSNSTSKRLSDGLKRRFGSLHRKDK